MLEILAASPLTTIQDSGRRGWQAYGVPVSGPMDAFAHRATNLLAANPPDVAALEIGISACFLTHTDCVIAATGPGFTLTIDDHPARMWTSVYVPSNRRIQLERTDSGNWGYLSIHGGIKTDPALGSRSGYLRAALTSPLRSGDLLPTGAPTHPLINLTRSSIPRTALPYQENPVIRVISGPQADFFTQASLRDFYNSSYSISSTSDRMGYRLTGQPLTRHTNSELLSEGMARGCIQIPADGLPIVMQADCPPTGGYPKIASVITADQPLLAQIPIGEGQIRFTEVTIEEAQSAYRKMIQNLIIHRQIAEDGVW